MPDLLIETVVRSAGENGDRDDGARDALAGGSAYRVTRYVKHFHSSKELSELAYSTSNTSRATRIR